MKKEDPFEINKATWNQKAQIHFESAFYDKSAFAKAKNALNSYELKALNDVSGKSMLHLQCHFGQDSLSWAHRGAEVTGVDLSDEAIKIARKLSDELEIPAQFVCCNVLDTGQHVKEQFDIVFTSYGVIGWLPNLADWAKVIADRLKPGGVFYIVEFHPIAWMYDYTTKPPKLRYPYTSDTAIYEEYSGTYADQEADMISKEYGWNHSLSSVIQSLITAGLTIELFAEHEGSPYEIFPEMEQEKDGLYYFKNRLFPSLFEIKATKK